MRAIMTLPRMLLPLLLLLLPLPQGVLMALGATCPHVLLRDTWRLEDFALLKQVYKVGPVWAVCDKVGAQGLSQVLADSIIVSKNMLEQVYKVGAQGWGA